MAGALNMLVMHLGVVPVVPERPFHPRVLEGLPGDALLGCWLPWHGLSVLATVLARWTSASSACGMQTFFHKRALL